MTVALWTIYHFDPAYELYDDEAAAASQAAGQMYYDAGEHGVVMGVQYDDGRALRIEDWPAYLAAMEQVEAEAKARAEAAAAEPPKPRRPQRVIKDPFHNFTMDIDASEPAWLGRSGATGTPREDG